MDEVSTTTNILLSSSGYFDFNTSQSKSIFICPNTGAPIKYFNMSDTRQKPELWSMAYKKEKKQKKRQYYLNRAPSPPQATRLITRLTLETWGERADSITYILP